MLDNNVPDWALFTVDSIRETRGQVNENTKRLDALEQRIVTLEPQPEPQQDDAGGDEQ